MKKFLLALSFFISHLSFSVAQTNCATFPLNFDDGYVVLDGAVKIDIIVYNAGSAVIKSLKYTVQDVSTGSTSNERSATLAADIPSGEQGTATFRIPSGSDIGICQKNVTITQVNGYPNEASTTQASAVGRIHTLAEKVTKKTIEEEYTGTWCGYCPRGTVGMELLSEKYPDTYIGAAFHYDDEFWFSEVGYHDGFPQCELNRHVNVDPYNGSTGNEPFGIEKDFNKEQNILPEASLVMKATWADEAKKKVNIKSDMRFVYNTDDEFALLYIVTEDGKSGSSQRSYYGGDSDYAGDPYMEYWYNGGTTNKYDHVVVAFAGRENGIEGSVSSPVTVGMQQSFDYTIDLSGALSRISNKDNLHMIVCLLNKTTDTIINTDFGSITIDDPSGIEEVENLKPETLNLKPYKYIKGGRVIIENGGKQLTPAGQEIE